MKRLFTLAGFVCLIAMVLPACAPAPAPEPEAAPEPVFDQAAEEAAVREMMKQAYAAANMHDVEAFVAYFVEDFEWSPTIKGRAAWAKNMSDSWERQNEVQYKELEEISLIFVTSDVAIRRLREEVTGSLDADEEPLQPQKRFVAYVLVKKNNAWLIAAAIVRPIEE